MTTDANGVPKMIPLAVIEEVVTHAKTVYGAGKGPTPDAFLEGIKAAAVNQYRASRRPKTVRGRRARIAKETGVPEQEIFKS